MSGLRVAVVGGSIGGCAAALAAHRAGHEDITVYERTSGDLASRGLGVAVHRSRYAELERRGYLDAAMPWTPMVERRWYVRDGGEPLGRLIGAGHFPFRTYNWGPLWRELRSRLPASVVFRSGTAVGSAAESAAGVRIGTASGVADYDLVVGADGRRSVIREAVCPGVRPAHAGYLAWRGAYPESRLPDPGRWERSATVYAVFDGGHAVIYRIPDGGGGHLVNWVLYTAPPPGAGTGVSGPAAPLHPYLAGLVEDRLPPFWSTLVGLTTPGELIVQPMYDFTAAPGVTGRIALLGDAAAVARPHTGAGAVKALQDATLLEDALTAHRSLPAALAAYDTARSAVGGGMVDLGRRLGHALVEATPPWGSLDRAGLDAWWEEADAAGLFGGRRLDG
ncbi:FAD binding domain-containing protein [Streptomyces amakusaensis]|uniref:FAD-dependent monooxygenase n=1 Tax=Streptomyces amakusaensis TaxID=67271 RepID=A0ABW0AL56_9ACTN